MLIDNDIQPNMLSLLVLKLILKAHFRRRHTSQIKSSTLHIQYLIIKEYHEAMQNWLDMYIFENEMFMSWNEVIVTSSTHLNYIEKSK